MSDLALRWGIEAADLVVEANDLLLDGGLETAVILSLFTDRRADEADRLPDGHTDRRGWWGDAFPPEDGDRIGSRLWLLARETQQLSVLSRAETYATEALEWLRLDRVASRVAVHAEFSRPGWIVLQVVIERPQVDPVEYRFNYIWAAQAARVGT